MNLSDLTDDEIEMICDILSMHEDRGPSGYGWQSDELQMLSEKLQKIVHGEGDL